jgi:ABC-2 type transport system permease protein
MTAAGLIGLFSGVLVRGAAAAITSMFGLLLVLPLLADKITPDAVTRHTVPISLHSKRRNGAGFGT